MVIMIITLVVGCRCRQSPWCEAAWSHQWCRNDLWQRQAVLRLCQGLGYEHIGTCAWSIANNIIIIIIIIIDPNQPFCLINRSNRVIQVLATTNLILVRTRVFIQTETSSHPHFSSSHNLIQILSSVKTTLMICSAMLMPHTANSSTDWLTYGPFHRPRAVVGWLDDCSWQHLLAGCLLHPPCLSPDQRPDPSLHQQSHQHQEMTARQRPDYCRHPGPGWTAGVEDFEVGWEFP